MNLTPCLCGGAGCKLCGGRTGPPMLFLPIEPMGAVRTTQKQKFVDERAAKYLNYKAEILWMVKSRLALKEPLTGPMKVNVTFYMPIPQSGKTSRKDPETGKRKQYYVAHGEPHIAKPDIDNLIKGLFDSLNNFVWLDDSQVCEVYSRKVYGEMVGIEFSVEAV